MTAQDRVRWDTIYRKRSEALPPPDPLMYEYTPRVNPDLERRALDLAGGLGQNALWLATQGYVVDLMDISRVALNRAREEMTNRKIRSINLLQVDIDALTLEPTYYDVICVFRYLKRDILPQLRDAIAPGGRLIYETFNLHYLESVPEFNVEFLVQGDELKHAFEGWNFIYYSNETQVTQIVAVKPHESPNGSKAEGSPPSRFDW